MKKVFYFLLTKSIGLYINFLNYFLPTKAVQLAHRFFSEPKKGKFTIEQMPKTLQTAKPEQIHHNQDQIQTYVWQGNETIVLLIHGWESNSSRWKKLIPFLQKSGCTIVAIDGPAQGLSPGKEFTILKYAEYIDAVAQKYPPTCIIGHSMGGKTCLYYQSKYQNSSLKKIVVLGAPSDFNLILKNFTSLLGLNDAVKKALKTKYTAIIGDNIDNFSGAKFASKINTKGFLAHDEEDHIVLFEEGKKIAHEWANCIFVPTKGLGHKLHDDDLYAKIYEFLFNRSF